MIHFRLVPEVKILISRLFLGVMSSQDSRLRDLAKEKNQQPKKPSSFSILDGMSFEQNSFLAVAVLVSHINYNSLPGPLHNFFTPRVSISKRCEWPIKGQ